MYPVPQSPSTIRDGLSFACLIIILHKTGACVWLRSLDTSVSKTVIFIGLAQLTPPAPGPSTRATGRQALPHN